MVNATTPLERKQVVATPLRLHVFAHGFTSLLPHDAYAITWTVDGSYSIETLCSQPFRFLSNGGAAGAQCCQSGLLLFRQRFGHFAKGLLGWATLSVVNVCTIRTCVLGLVMSRILAGE